PSLSTIFTLLLHAALPISIRSCILSIFDSMPNFKAVRRKIKYRFLYFFVKSLILISNWMPRRVWLSFCGTLGKAAYTLAKKSKQQTLKHLTLAFKEEKSPKEIRTIA